MKNYLFIFIILSLFIVSCTSDEMIFMENQDFTLQTRTTPVEEIEELEVSDGALDLLKVYDSFTAKVFRSSDKVLFPDYYGGAYVNDKGKLIILVTEKPGYYKQIFREILGHKDFLVHKCNYSYNELNNCMNEIDEYRDKNSEYFRDVSNLYYISDSENRIYVTLKNISKSNIEEFKEKVNHFSGIEFIESDGEFYFASELNPGRPTLNVKLTGGGAATTLGYRAKRNGVEGVVVAGHSFKNGDRLHFDDVTSTAYIGTATTPIVGGSVDCAFVPVDIGTPSNIIYGTQYVLSAQTSSPGAGTFVNFKGRHTTRGGNIVNTRASATFRFKDDTSRVYNYTNLTNVNLPVAVQHGDSGGIVYSYVSSTNTRYNVGNIVGYGTEDGLSYYAKTPETILFLGITLY